MGEALYKCVLFNHSDSEEDEDADLGQFTIIPGPNDETQLVDSPYYGPSECLLCYAEILKVEFPVEIEFEVALTNQKIDERMQDKSAPLNMRRSLATADVKKWLLPPMKDLRDKRLSDKKTIKETIKKFEKNALCICTDHFNGHPQTHIVYITTSPQNQRNSTNKN